MPRGPQHHPRRSAVPLAPCRLELESATHGERVSGGRVRGRLRSGLRARARAPRQGGPGLYPSPLPLSPRGSWQSNRGVGRGGGTLRSGGVGAHGHCKRPHAGCSAPSDGNRRMHLVAGWQAEGFGYGCTGLRNMPAKGSNARPGSVRPSHASQYRDNGEFSTCCFAFTSPSAVVPFGCHSGPSASRARSR
jgi:hypothetical protein